jgi:glycosyltransferase involved in cell wall biosynthesis
VVPPGDAEALQRAIRRLLGDSPLREQLGMAGRVHARANWERTAVLDRFVEALRSSVKHPN